MVGGVDFFERGVGGEFFGDDAAQLQGGGLEDAETLEEPRRGGLAECLLLSEHRVVCAMYYSTVRVRRCACFFLSGWGELGHAIWLMFITLLKSKLHRACVTEAEVNYLGSITISADLARAVGLREYEHVLVSNMSNGARLETYVIYGPGGRGVIGLNGAAALLGKVGDRLTIMNFGQFSEAEAEAHHPRKALLDEKNVIIGEA